MSFAAFRRMGFVAAWAVGVTLMAAPGCSAQGEGERCNAADNGDEDCDEGLLCVQADQLQDSSIGDRCCAPEGAPIGDARCNRKTGAGPSTGGAGATSGGAGSGAAGSSSGGGGTSGGSGGNADPATGGADSNGADSSGAGGV